MTSNDTTSIPPWVFDELPAAMAEKLRAAAPYVRSPKTVMSAETMHGMSASRLSFAQTLVTKMAEQRWQITLQQCEIAEDSTGYMAYDIRVGDTQMSFGVFVYDPLPPGKVRLFRENQVEFLGILLEGPIDEERFRAEKAQFDAEVWRGRTNSDVLGWTIAGRGTRMFDRVVDALVAGEQPSIEDVDANGGYILRNGGYYGNGRMGSRSWRRIASEEGPLSAPYHVDLFSVYLWRLVSLDLVEATAKRRNADAVALDPRIRRHVGIGNSSGLGTVAALIRWPERTSTFVLARELAFACAVASTVTEANACRLEKSLANAAAAYRAAPGAPEELIEPRDHVAAALDKIAPLARSAPTGRPWAEIVDHAQVFDSVEAVEVLRALLVDLDPELVCLSRIIRPIGDAPVITPEVDPLMSVGELRDAIDAQYAWVATANLTGPGKREFFWYRSEENGENRRGERSVDVGTERETIIDITGMVRRLTDFLRGYDAETSVGRFLLEEPEHALTVARVQLAARMPYSEVQASVCDEEFVASTAIRCFLALLGIELPTPHSGRWVRGLFYRGAPLPPEIAEGIEGEWGIGATHPTSLAESA